MYGIKHEEVIIFAHTYARERQKDLIKKSERAVDPRIKAKLDLEIAQLQEKIEALNVLYQVETGKELSTLA